MQLLHNLALQMRQWLLLRSAAVCTVHGDVVPGCLYAHSVAIHLQQQCTVHAFLAVSAMSLSVICCTRLRAAPPVLAVIVKASSGPRYVVGCRNKVDKAKLASGTRVALDMTTLTIMRALPREVGGDVVQQMCWTADSSAGFYVCC
jgi:ATP-dependent 26S proteasome regulatory subunit